MCGIFGILDIKSDVAELRTQALELSKLLRHRGPDWSGIWNNDNAINAGNIICSSNKSIHNKVLKILKPVSK